MKWYNLLLVLSVAFFYNPAFSHSKNRNTNDCAYDIVICDVDE